MKTKAFTIFVLTIASMILTQSCDDENHKKDGHGSPLEFNIVGSPDIEYNALGDTSFEIPASGAEFTVSGYDPEYPEYLSAFFLRSFGIKNNNKELFIFESTETMFGPWIASWGAFEYLLQTPPYVIKFKIEPNTGAEQREIYMHFGVSGCGAGGSIWLTQAGAE